MKCAVKMKLSVMMGMLTLLALGAVSFAAPELLPSAERAVASVAFPRLHETSDNDDILREYPAYLNFVLAVGRDVNPPMAKRLAYTYQQLRRRSPEGAARFLRGLRFEMVYKLELMGANPASINARSPVMRHWVAKYMPEWWREADEGLFRSLVRR